MSRRSSIGRVCRVAVAGLAIGAVLLAVPSRAAAHPLGNVSVNRYLALVVGVDAVAVDLVVDAAEIPTLEATRRIDREGDGVLGPAELDAARANECDAALSRVSISIGGEPVRLSLVAAGLTLRPGSGGLATLRTVCELRGAPASPIAGPTEVLAAHAAAGTAGWREIVIRGDGVTVDDPAAGVDHSLRLTSYPIDPLAPPMSEGSLVAIVRPGGPAHSPLTVDDAWPLDGGEPRGTLESPGVAAAPRPGAEPAWAVDPRQLTPAVAALGILLAALSGAGHALAPGHGKTLMAAFLIGARGRPRDAVALGLAVTASHTIGVVALGGLVLLAGRALPADRVLPVLSVGSGLLVAGIGAWLLVGCIRRSRAGGGHDHDHSHEHPHGHGHAHPHGAEPSAISRRSVLVIGLAGGMVPSTAALVLLLGAVAAGQPAFGIALALAFGAGMASVLVVLGMVVVRGRDRLAGVTARVPVVGRLTAVLPWGAAVVVLSGGLLLALRAIGGVT